MNCSFDLKVVHFKNPVIAASGTFGFGHEFAKEYDLSLLGGISTKGTTLEAKAGNKGQRSCETDVNVVDVSGLTIMPSFADLHVHLRDPGFLHKETLETGVKAAVNGGYTHIVAMANTKPVADNTEVIADVLARAQKLSLAEVYQASSVSIGEKGEKTVDFRSLRSLTKFFSDDGKNVDSEELFAEALRASKELDFLIMDHSEPETEMVLRWADTKIRL